MAHTKKTSKYQQVLAAILASLSFSALTCSASLAQAVQEDGLPPSYPKTRKTVAQQQYPWRSIGSLSIAGRQFCTATLINETQVITAAHCLWNPDRDDWYPAPFIHFLADYKQGEYLGHSTALSISPNPRYQYTAPPELKSLRHDWALVTLQKPLGKKLGFIPLQHTVNDNTSAPALHLQLAGYRQDRPEVLSVATQCLRTAALNRPSALAGFLVHNCEALSGDSGGPLLSGAHLDEIKPGSVFLEGIHVGRHHNQSRSDSLAISAETIMTTLKKE